MKLQERLRERIVPGMQRLPDGVLLTEAADALDAQEARIKVLEEALRAIIERWDTPNWKDAEHTGAVINRARAALEGK